MNVLSLLAVTTAVLFFSLAAKRAQNSKHDKLTQISVFVCACLGWWAFCDAFFYVAQTESAAWMWHRLGALGWSGFIPVTAYFFLNMADGEHLFDTMFKQLIYWAPASIITVLLMTTPSTALADQLVQSTSGLGWAYQQSFHSFWPVIYLMELFAYLGFSLVRLYLWQKNSEEEIVRKISKQYIVIDIAAVAVGFAMVYIIPQFSIHFPPCCFIATMIFYIGYRDLQNSDLTHIEFALNPDSIFDNSMDAMLITDIAWHVLYANEEAKKILGVKDSKKVNFLDTLTKDGQREVQAFKLSEDNRISGLDLTVSNSIPMLSSISKTMTKKGDRQVFIISLHDASSLKNAQEKLDYLAHFDELTGLPNRRRLGDLLDQWELKYARMGKDFSILFLDLNQFKRINDKYGHSAGDTALKVTSKVLEGCVPKEDIVTRLAGDEFIVLHGPKAMPPEELVKTIDEAIENIDCSTFAPGAKLGVSIGCCKYSEAGSIRELFKLADERMYEIKKQRDN